MYRASACRASSERKLRNCSVIAGRLASMCKSEIKSVATLLVMGDFVRLGFGDTLDAFDDHGLERRIFLE
jgi:hypothetical protein